MFQNIQNGKFKKVLVPNNTLFIHLLGRILTWSNSLKKQLYSLRSEDPDPIDFKVTNC